MEMYTVVWTTFDGLHVSVMNTNELNEFLNVEGNEINWLGSADVFNWERANEGFIIKGDAIVPKVKTYSKLSI